LKNDNSLSDSRSEWETVYDQGKQNNTFPWSDLVSLFFQFKPQLQTNQSMIRALEYGSGTCNNYPLFKFQEIEYWGVETSVTANSIATKKFPELDSRLINSTFLELPKELTGFDYVIDRGSITCNSSSYIKNVVSEIYSKLLPGGIFIGIDWFSDKHSEFQSGENLDGDELTKHKFKTGYFKNLGITHFTNHSDLNKTLSVFEVLYMAEKIVDIKETEFETGSVFSSWSFVARKNSASS
jgi:SAM-dependent methyltransferase